MPEELEDLIRKAFLAARESGKPDWYRMTAAVLKNRLLILTNRRFNESDYEATSFTELLVRLPNLLRLDVSVFPPVAQLIDPDAVAANLELSTVGTVERVRPDIWRGFMDFSSGTTYVWDRESGRVRIEQPGDDPHNPRVPAIDRDELARWREDFVATQRETLEETGEDLSQVLIWKGKRLGSRHLPSRLRGAWTDFMQERVATRAREWFAQLHIHEPSDLVRQVGPTARDIRARVRSREHRDLLVQLVNLMTDEEIEALHLPVSAMLRLLSRRKDRS